MSWGTEAEKAGEEILRLIEMERQQAIITGKAILGAGASSGSHSINYRMWEGSYYSNVKDNIGKTNDDYVKNMWNQGNIRWSNVNKAVEKGLKEVSDEEVVVNEDKEAEKEVENSEVKEESNENIHDKTQKINQPYYSNKKNNKK